MSIDMYKVIKLQLTPAAHQPPAPVPPVFVTSGLTKMIGGGVDDFLQSGYPKLPEIVKPKTGFSHSLRGHGLIYGLADEVVAMAVAQGLQSHSGITCLATLCENVFVQGGFGWPSPIRQIGRVVSGQSSDTTPWAIVALPMGCRLILNGKNNEGMTTSPLLTDRVFVPDEMRHQALACEAEQAPAIPFVTTYLNGELWENRNALLPTKVVLHEASHRVNFGILNDWMDTNAARPVDEQDPAFRRHCVQGKDRKYYVDFTFATMFFEIAACIATGFFFQDLIKINQRQPIAKNADLFECMIKGMGMGTHFMQNSVFKPYFEKSGIPAPDLTDAISITRTMQRFVAQVSKASAAV